MAKDAAHDNENVNVCIVSVPHVGKDLLDIFPDAISDVYDQEPYAGENLLHIAIVNRNFDMVKWLVQRQPELMHGAGT